jgi:hypothetical protein
VRWPDSRARLVITFPGFEEVLPHVQAHKVPSMTDDSRERVAERLELAASVAWFFMDFAWMEQSTAFALGCAVPTTVCSLAAVAFVKREFPARAVTMAMAMWAIMNSLWMMSDLHVYAGLWAARICFAMGLALLLAALIVTRSGRRLLAEMIGTFRRLRARR